MCNLFDLELHPIIRQYVDINPLPSEFFINTVNLMLKFHLPTSIKATAGGITKIPTSQSATAKLITKQLVTVRNRRVVSTDNITSVFPITVIF